MTRSAPSGRDTVVTGVGLVTAAGPDRESTWAAMLAGAATAAPHPELAGLPVSIACRVVEGDYPVLQARGSKRLDPVIRFALAATAEALEQAGLDPATWDGARVAVVTGSGGGIRSFELAGRTFAATGPATVSPYFLPGYLANMSGANIALRFGARGPSIGVATACASGTTAIALADDLITMNRCDIAIVCGAEAAIMPVFVTGFQQIGALSATGSRPFDTTRDGFVMGEGAGALILERGSHAIARQAIPLARVLGHAANTDAHHVVSPDPEGNRAQSVVESALVDARIAAAEIDHVNAHGTATRLNDHIEATVLDRVFRHRPPVTSSKGALGHTLSAAGAIEAGLTVLALRTGLIPPTAGLTDLDPELRIDVVSNAARRRPMDVAVSTSFGFGGHNAALVLGRA